MAPTPLTATLRYIPPGTRKIYWLTTIASYATAVTRAEINAGTDLTNEIARNVRVRRHLARPRRRRTCPPGSPRRSPAGSPPTTRPSASTRRRPAPTCGSVLPRDTVGYVVILPEGDVPTQKMDVLPRQGLVHGGRHERWRTRRRSTWRSLSPGSRR